MALLDRFNVDELRALVARASPEELPGLLDVLNGELAGLSDEAMDRMRTEPALMAAYVTRGAYRLWRYNRLLSAKFVDAVEGRSRFQIWNVPARLGKSLTARWGLVWLLETRPESESMYVSYGHSLAKEGAVFVRDALEAYPEIFTTRLRRDRRAADRFVTSAGGGLLAAGVGGAIAGFGAGRGGGIFIDDPFKNWQEAHSEARREEVWNWYRSVLRLRLQDEHAWIIVVMTRWHEDDLSGRLLGHESDDEWELIRIPAIAEEYDPTSTDPFLRIPDPLGRAPGEVIEPERFPITEVRARASSLGSYLAAALEQQRPAPAEGGEIKRVWWKWTSSMPETGDMWITSWDMKLKEKESGDYVVGQAWSRTGAAFYCHSQLRGQWTMRGTACAIALLSVRFPLARRHYIENTGNGPEVMQILRAPEATARVPDDIADRLAMTPNERKAVTEILRRGLPGLMPVNPRGDKRARVRIVSGYIEAGNVWLPEDKDWALGLVNEAAAFPNGSYDDQVDALSQALAALSGRARRGLAPGGEQQDSPWN